MGFHRPGSSPARLGMGLTRLGSGLSQFGSVLPQFGSGRAEFGSCPAVLRSHYPWFGSRRPVFPSHRAGFGSCRSVFGSARADRPGAREESGSTRPVLGSHRPVFGSPRGDPSGARTEFGSTRPVFGSRRPVFGSCQAEPTAGRRKFGPGRPDLVSARTELPEVRGESGVTRADLAETQTEWGMTLPQRAPGTSKEHVQHRVTSCGAGPRAGDCIQQSLVGNSSFSLPVRMRDVGSRVRTPRAGAQSRIDLTDNHLRATGGRPVTCRWRSRLEKPRAGAPPRGRGLPAQRVDPRSQ